MNTPIVDFVKNYSTSDISRLHMPGHKGCNITGNEMLDITEINGADSLYHADSIIFESETNAANLYGSARTLYSAEGSTHCIKSMVALAALLADKNKGTPVIYALRNVHKAFINACALTDIDAHFIFPDEANTSICSCPVSFNKISNVLSNAIKGGENVIALYMTSPDYLGNIYDVKEIAKICHSLNILLLVDNAHGSYLNFLDSSMHPMSYGADMCSDSAHKTLPVLTGGAYLHISKTAPSLLADMAKDVMSLFGSTSPSYLILESLDMCNSILSTEYRIRLQYAITKIDATKRALMDMGFTLIGNEPLKITVHTSPIGITGNDMADLLRHYKVECEYSDNDFVVLMPGAYSKDIDYDRIINAYSHVTKKDALPQCVIPLTAPETAMSIRQAVFSKQEKINIHDSLGRICAMSVVSCPPAIPIIVSGEVISTQMISLLEYYGITDINVVS